MIHFQPIRAGMTFAGLDGTSREVLEIFGRGRNRQVRYRNLRTGQEQLTHVARFRSLIAFLKVPVVE